MSLHSKRLVKVIHIQLTLLIQVSINGGIQSDLELIKNYTKVQLVYYYFHALYYLQVGYIYSQNSDQVYRGLKIMNLRLNHHLSGLLGVSSLAWTGHLVHVAITCFTWCSRWLGQLFNNTTTSCRINSILYR